MTSDEATNEQGGITVNPTLGSGAIELPDIKKSAQKRKSSGGKVRDKEESSESSSEDDTPSRFSSVSRSDPAGLKLLLESDPTGFDPSPARAPGKKTGDLNSEDYSVISLALGEGGRSFFGVPFAALQVGHGILSLILLLISTVDYPGFPLTSLPPIVRHAVGTSMLATYGVNLMLAAYVVLAEVPSRVGQEDKGNLWGIKTIAVGGLALDQIRQIPKK
ncbi:hypothetical protein TrRE_jg5526 [Triparma retinervis]|uniref:Uncharacterized protein n=1 Tax=Triparma retinervis TaxID=2557542 RepID=A0A9W7A2Y6_9STRA|nr:hypothetical protein TrRE_jg5526 [Triparma retinervis]